MADREGANLVQLINLDGASLLGPGSEWFWTAMSGLALFITFIAIYSQLRAQRAATAFAQTRDLAREWESEEMSRFALKVVTALRSHRADPADVPDGAAIFIGNYWDTVGLLVRAGHIDARLVHDIMGVNAQWWWAALRPFFERIRAEHGIHELHADFEWLARRMAELDEADRSRVVYDDALLEKTLDRRLRNYRDRIQMADEKRGIGHTPAPERTVKTAPRTRESPGPATRD